MMLSLPNLLHAGGTQAYLFRGGPVDIQHSSVYQASDIMQGQLKRKYRADFKAMHQSQRTKAYKEILATHRAGSPKRIILVGHSFGVPAAVDVANRLKQHGIKVALLVSVDARQGATKMRANSIPNNVVKVENYYETSSGLPGTPVFRRTDGGKRGILNKELTMDGGLRHSRLLKKVADSKLLGASISGKNINAVFDGNTSAKPIITSSRAKPVRVKTSSNRKPKKAPTTKRESLLARFFKSFKNRKAQTQVPASQKGAFPKKAVPSPKLARVKTSSYTPSPRALRVRAAASEGWKRGGPFGWIVGIFKGFFSR